jgi:DNA-binding transcriptional regulator/RsmH inhibitor MraZ
MDLRWPVAENPRFSPTIPETNVAETLQLEERAPAGYYDCSVDAKSRLKIPADFLRYMKSKGSQFFLTSFDGLDISIYTRDSFEEQIKLLEQVAQDPDFQEDAESIIAMARHWGADVVPDADSRVHLPPVLRAQLGLTDLPAPCHMGMDRDHIVVMTGPRYQAMLDRSRPRLADANKRLRVRGLR